VQDAEQRRAALSERLDGRSPATVVDDFDAAAAEFDRTAELAELIPARESTVDELVRAETQLAEHIAATELQKISAGNQRATLAEIVAERAERLELARGAHADIATRRTYLLTLATALDGLAELRDKVITLRERHAEDTAAVAKAAADAGFSEVTEALEAVRQDGVITDFERRLSDFANRHAVATATLAEPELAGADPDAEVDPRSAHLAAEQAREAAETAATSRDTACQRLTQAQELGTRLHAALEALAPEEAAYGELAALTDVVNGRGQNARKMSLRSYVLAARLEEVAIAATRRLHRMTQGRYTFVHSDAAGARGTRGGLGLDVLDDYSGRIRPAKTLSGGESFLASLALALGLADVVATETGGALLDTLFVDEGFGALDADTLDLVMNTLDELRAGGRVVGLVSHVEELRQRIPVRLKVKRARTGSTLELTAA
jgi:exonuclease SbcC